MESNGGARVSFTEVIKRYTTYVIRSRHLTLMMVSKSNGLSLWDRLGGISFKQDKDTCNHRSSLTMNYHLILSFSHGGFSKKKNILNEQAIKTTMKPRLDKEPLMLVVSLTKYVVSPNFV